MRIGSILTAVLFIATTGCGSPRPVVEPEGLLETDEFIEVYLELRRAATSADSTADLAAIRAEILERHGVTAQDLLDFVEWWSNDLHGVSVIWDTIYQRAKDPST